MIINKSDATQVDIPTELDGEVLLDTQVNKFGTVTVYITASQETCDQMRKSTPGDREAAGWDKYQSVLDALPAILPKMNKGAA